MEESVSGVLTIDAKVLQQLQNAQDSLRKLSNMADKLGASMKDARSEAEKFGASLSKLKVPKIEIGIQGRNPSGSITRMIDNISKADLTTPFNNAVVAITAMRDRLREVTAYLGMIKHIELSPKNIDDIINGMQQTSEASEEAADNIENVGDALDASAKAADSLKKMLAGLVGVRQLAKMVKSAVEVRGEFEMSERSLGFIIGDLSQATAIFENIKELAVVSPFQVGDLVGQTRQLAAYGIETEKLSGTMKQLGDIASGVGVDMGRLILAYGQVKAAQFLRLTEVRQFTEAGVDVLGGLATYFSEIEHRSVSVGEVMDRITKKMVTFSDLEVVITRMTSAGGKFYNMQEKQADTIQGSISNLEDRWNIAINDFVSTYDDAIRGVVGALGGLSNALVVIAPLIISSLSFVGVAGGVKLMESAYQGVKKLITGFKTLSAVSKGANIAGVVVAIISAITLAVMNARKLSREIKKINLEAEVEASNLTEKYRSLTEEIENATNGSEAQRRAMESLRAEFGNILPAIDLESEKIGELTDKYQDHIQAIRTYMVEKANQQKKELMLQKVNETASREFDGTFYTGFNTATNHLVNVARTNYKDARQILKEAYQNAALAIVEGSLKPDKEAISAYIAQLVSDYYGIVDENMAINMYQLGSSLADIAGKFKKQPKIDLNVPVDQAELQGKITNLQKFYGNIKDILKDSGLFEDDAAQMDVAITHVMDAYGRVLKANISNKELDMSQFVSSLKQAIEAVKQMPEVAAASGDNTSKAFKAAIDKVDWVSVMRQAADNAGQAFWTGVESGIAASDNWDAVGRMMGQRIDEAMGKVQPDELRQRLKEILSEVNNHFADMPIALPEIQSRQGLSDYAKGVYELWQQQIKNVQIVESAAGDADLKNIDLLMRFGYTQGDEESLKRATQKLKDYRDALAELWTYLSAFYEPSKTGGSGRSRKPKDYLKELMEAVAAFPKDSKDKLVSEVQHLKDQMNDLAKGVGDTFISGFAEGFDPDKVTESEESIKAFLEKYKDKVDKGIGDELQFTVGITFDKFAIDEAKRQASTLFSDFQIAIDLEAKGIHIEGYDSEQIMRDIIDIENRIRNTYGDITSADELFQKRLAIMKKDQEEIIKLMEKKTTEGLSKTAQIISQAQKDISRIGTVNDNSDSTGKRATQQDILNAKLSVMLQMMNHVNDENYKMLKGTQLYTMAFGDLEEVSYNALVGIKSLFDQLSPKDGGNPFGLSPEDLKAVNKQLDVVEKRLIEMRGGNKKGLAKRGDLFGVTFGYLSEAGKGIKTLNGDASVEGSRAAQQEALDKYNKALLELKGIQDNYTSMLGKTWEELTEDQRIAIESTLDYKNAEEKVRTATQEADTATQSYRNTINRVKTNLESAKTQLGNIQSAFGSMTSIIDGSVNIVESFAEGIGMAFGDDTQEYIAEFKRGFDIVSQGLTVFASGLTLVSTMMTVLNVKADELLIKLWPLALASAVLGTLFVAFKAADKALENTLEEQKDLADALSKSYDDLKKSIGEAQELNELNRKLKETNDNLTAQVEALQAAKEAEMQRTRYKMGSDASMDEIKSLNEKIDETLKKRKEVTDEYKKALGMPTEWSSEANDWADAWLSAFKQGEDGVESLRQSFDDMYDDMVARQIKNKVLSPLMKDLENEIETAMSDGNLTDAEAAQIRSLADIFAAYGDKQARELAQKLGISYGSEQSQSQSTLSGSIQNITEATADALEALLNSTRYYVADSNAKIQEILGALVNINGESNPMLLELKTHTTILSSIYSLLDSNTKSGHKSGGSGFKSFAAMV